MGIPLRVIERPLNHDGSKWAPSNWYPPEGAHEVGDMWRVPELDLPDRESWAIVLPNGAGIWFTTDTPGIKGSGAVWDVTGTPPLITVNPSINSEPEWHGWIKNGVME